MSSLTSVTRISLLDALQLQLMRKICARYLTERICLILDMPCSSDSTSDQDGYGPSTSLDSNMDGRRMWQRSGMTDLHTRAIFETI